MLAHEKCTFLISGTYRARVTPIIYRSASISLWRGDKVATDFLTEHWRKRTLKALYVPLVVTYSHQPLHHLMEPVLPVKILPQESYLER
jgi:hypothetical protein